MPAPGARRAFVLGAAAAPTASGCVAAAPGLSSGFLGPAVDGAAAIELGGGDPPATMRGLVAGEDGAPGAGLTDPGAGDGGGSGAPDRALSAMFSGIVLGVIMPPVICC